MPDKDTYHTTVHWKEKHLGHVRMGNGPEMDFSAPPDAHGCSGVLTPEDAFVAAVNTCVMMMFLWSAERFRLDLKSYECLAEGTKRIELDRTEQFTQIVLRPRITVCAGKTAGTATRKRTERALESAVKYSLVANSIKSALILEPQIEIVTEAAGSTENAASRK